MRPESPAWLTVQSLMALTLIRYSALNTSVGKDNVVRFGGHRLRIMPTNGRLSYVKANVEVYERMNGSLAVYYKGQCLLTRSAPPEAPVLRVRNTARFIPGVSDSRELAPYLAAKTAKANTGHPFKPASDHP